MFKGMCKKNVYCPDCDKIWGGFPVGERVPNECIVCSHRTNCDVSANNGQVATRTCPECWESFKEKVIALLKDEEAPSLELLRTAQK